MKLNICLPLLALLMCGCGVLSSNMTQDEKHNAWVIRTDFTDEAKWTTVRQLVAAPQREQGLEFYAYVNFKDDKRYDNLDPIELVHSLPDDYPGFFCFVVDSTTLENDEHPVLVIGFSPNSVKLEDYQRTPKQTPASQIQTFRAIPSAIPGIENNLSIANMDFEDFADSTDADGVFRDFPR